MSSQKTKNYQLHAWEGEDKFLRTEMNENFATLDSAIAEVKSTAAGDLAAAKTALSGEISSASASATLDGKLNAYAATAQTNLNSVQNSLTSSINSVSAVANGKTTVVTGSYTGDGTATRSISLGFQPRIVFVTCTEGHTSNNYYVWSALALAGKPVVGVTITEDGFQVSYVANGNSSYMVPQTNDSRYSFNFVALR